MRPVFDIVQLSNPLPEEKGPREQDPEPDGPAGFGIHLANDRTAIIARREVFEKMLSAEQVKSKLVERLQHVDADCGVIVAATTEGAARPPAAFAIRMCPGRLRSFRVQ